MRAEHKMREAQIYNQAEGEMAQQFKNKLEKQEKLFRDEVSTIKQNFRK